MRAQASLSISDSHEIGAETDAAGLVPSHALTLLQAPVYGAMFARESCRI
jgi:hypothetical protein